MTVTSTLERPDRRTGPHLGGRTLGVIVTGSLTGVPAGIVAIVLDDLLAECTSDGTRMVVVEGGMSGADAGARRWAASYRHAAGHIQIAPDWRRYGGSAYRVANQLMLDVVRPALVLAFSQSIGTCYRARDLIARAHAAAVPYVVLGSQGVSGSGDGSPMRFLPDPPPRADGQQVLFDGFGTPSDAWRRRSAREACSLLRRGD